MQSDKNNKLIIVVKLEKYIEYMLTILVKLPRTEKFNIGNEIKISMYNMLKYTLLASKLNKNKRLELYNVVDCEIYYQRICIIIMETIILPFTAITIILIITTTISVSVWRSNIKLDYIF